MVPSGPSAEPAMASEHAGAPPPFRGIDPHGKTPEEIERYWYEHVYQGDHMPQLTGRAILMGMLLGSVMAFSNLYVGLKTGWGLGVTITACILSFAIFRTLHLAFGMSEPSILENNCMQSTASAAGYSTGSTLISAFAAYLMITGHHPPMLTTMSLVFFLGVLGVFMAIPMKRNMVNVEQLAFPTGTASAETLRSLHAAGAEAVLKAKSLFVAMGLGAVVAWARDGMPSVVEKLKLPALAGRFLTIPNFLPLKDWLKAVGFERAATYVDENGYTFSVENSTIMIAAGAIMGIRVGWSMLLGAFICFGVLAPIMHSMPVEPGSAHHVIDTLGYRGIVTWAVWPGVSIMISSALLSFGMQWRTVARAFSGLGSLFGKKSEVEDPMEQIEVPASWFVVGVTLGTIGCVATNYYAFHIGILQGLLAVSISAFLAIVACRATGETDTTPVGALGKITQLTYGVLIPSNMTANLMTANITAAVATSSADLLTDLKSGYLLGANPRKQFLAQFAGAFAGTLVAVPAFYLLVPSPDVLGGNKFPAPSAQVWKAVAELLAKGVHSLHYTALLGMAVGAVVGIVITLAEMYLPKYRKYIPSATGLGLAFVIPAYNSMSMFLGALIAYVLEQKKPATAERYTIPVSAGFIAGESIMGIVVALLTAAAIL